MDTLLEIGIQAGLEGKELLNFVIEQQSIQREVRAAEREVEKLKAEATKIEAEAELQLQKEKLEAELQIEKLRIEDESQKEKLRMEDERLKRNEAEQQRLDLEKERMRLAHELEMRKLQHSEKTTQSYTMTPELPTYDEGRDSISAYLERFERFARIQKWETGMWAIILSALLTGRALEIYARLPVSEAANYSTVKAALLKGYNQTESGFRVRFRDSKPEKAESPTQFVTRLTGYLDKWIEMAEVTDYQGFRCLIIREQFLNQCPKELAIHLKERAFVSMEELCKQAERFLEARGQVLSTITENKDKANTYRGQEKNTTSELMQQRRECYNCGRLGHTKAGCRMEGGGNEQRCTHCNIFGHDADICRNKMIVAGVLQTRVIKASNTNSRKDRTQRSSHRRLYTMKGQVGIQAVNTLRDTGCNAICVKKKFVRTDQMTGKHRLCKLIDGSERKLETAVVDINTPYFTKKGATVVCMEDSAYDLVIGNVEGATCKCNPNPDWTPRAVTVMRNFPRDR